MRNVTLFVLAGLFFAGPSSAQNYPFPAKDAEWVTTHVSNYCIGGSNIYYLWREYLGPDTVLQGAVYQQVLLQPECKHVTTGTNCTGFNDFYSGGPLVVGGIRTVNDRVYFHRFDLPDSLFLEYEAALKNLPVETDILLYDFNWAVGDTAVYALESGDTWKFRVHNVEQSNGRRKITLRRLGGLAYEQTVWEGAGAASGLLGVYYSPAASSYLPLGTCFYHNAGQVLKADYCGVCGLVKTREAALLPARAYPNPAKESVFLETDSAGGPYRLEVFDLAGRLLYSDDAFPGNAVLHLTFTNTSGWLQIALRGSDGYWTGRIRVER